MTQPEWMPENPYPIEGRINTIRHFDFKAGCQQTASKIVEWENQMCKEHPWDTQKKFHLLHKDCGVCIKQLKKEVGL